MMRCAATRLWRHGKRSVLLHEIPARFCMYMYFPLSSSALLLLQHPKGPKVLPVLDDNLVSLRAVRPDALWRAGVWRQHTNAQNVNPRSSTAW